LENRLNRRILTHRMAQKAAGERIRTESVFGFAIITEGNLTFQFGEWALDPERFELLRNGEGTKVEPRVLDLLFLLVGNHARIVTKDEIVDQIWGGRIVSEATISTCIKSARQAIGDDGKEQNLIRTVHGRGFRFVGTLDAFESAEPVLPSPPKPAVGDSPTRPSLAILPMQVFDDDPELTAIADGLVENLTTVLTRVPLLQLTSRAASFSLKGQPILMEEVRQRFGVSLMLEGSLQGVGETLRANLQLIDTANGFHLWARQFDEPPGPDVIDRLVHAVLPHLEPQLLRAIVAHYEKDTHQSESHRLLIKAQGVMTLKGWRGDTFTEATQLLRKAADLEPDFALVHAHLALVLGLGHRFGLLDRNDSIKAEAEAEAELALELDNMDSNVTGLAACALSDIGQAKRAIPLLEQAIELNANNAQAWAALGTARLYCKQIPDAIADLTHGIKISPMDNRLSVWGTALAMAYVVDQQFDRAFEIATAACQRDQKAYGSRLALAVTCFCKKDEEGARAALAESYRMMPEMTDRIMDLTVGKWFGAALRGLDAER